MDAYRTSFCTVPVGLLIVRLALAAGLALALADRAYVIEDGRIVAQGTAAQIAADPALAQAYLGAQAGSEPGAAVAPAGQPA